MEKILNDRTPEIDRQVLLNRAIRVTTKNYQTSNCCAINRLQKKSNEWRQFHKRYLQNVMESIRIYGFQ